MQLQTIFDMRKAITLLLLTLCFGVMSGQNTPLHRIMVVLSNQYDETQAARKTPFMDKAQRLAFVINEHKAFCQASQAEAMAFLSSLKGEVEAIQPYWAFNGFSCLASDEVIRQLQARRDIALVYRDVLQKRIPENEKAYPVESKDRAWHVDKVNAPAVWNYNGATGYTGNGVIVAVLDTGVNYNHLDLAGSLWDGGAEYPHHGYDVVNHDNDPMDDHGHGSHCAGIVAGQGTAGTQTGIAPGAKVMVVKIMNADGSGGDAELIGGIEFALEHGADILSCSFGDAGTGGYDVYRQLYETVLDAGVVAAVAAGNDGQSQYAYPVPYNIECPGNCPPPWFHPDQTLTGGQTAVVCIGATDSNDSHSGFSSVGPVTWTEGEYIGDYHDYPYVNGDANKIGLIRPDVSAPGSNITSLNYLTNNGYVAYDGTSMATPCAAGVMALLLEANPELNPAQIDSLIELTAVKIGNYRKNNLVGSGRIDALAAVNALFHHGPTQLQAQLDGETVTLQWEAAEQAVSYNVYRDGLRVGTGLTVTNYTDHLQYAGNYTYYATAVFPDESNSLPSNYVTVEKPVVVEAELINGKRVALSWNLAPGVYEDFESGDLYQNLWVNDATSPWVVTTEEPNSGAYCVKSTNKGMFSSSKLSLAVNLPTACTLSYHAKISCFPLNGGGFFIDNVQYGETLKGNVPWTQYSVAIPAGNHLLEWKYANQLNEGQDEYNNTFYVDDLAVGNVCTVVRALCDGSGETVLAPNVGATQYVDYTYESLAEATYKYGIRLQGSNQVYWSECIEYAQVTEENAPATIRRVTVVTAMGQVLFDARVNEDVSSKVLDRQPAGVYLVTLHTDQGVVTKKVCR